jgi:hypothetical protein
MSKFVSCAAMAFAMFLMAEACSSHMPGGGAGGGPGGLGGTSAGGSGAGGTGTGGANGDGGSSLGGSGAGGAGTGGLGDAGGSGIGGTDAGSPTDAVFCCPPDPDPSRFGSATLIGEVRLGGVGFADGGCGPSFDFFCTTNWRLETDGQGCAIWRYDIAHDCLSGLADANITPVDAGDAASTD